MNRIAGLSAEERRTLLASLAGGEAEAPATFPLSFAQERLWFLNQLAPGTPFYNVPLTVPVPQPIDAAALERSLNGVVARHETLRTAFPVRDGTPVQAVAPALDVPLALHDLRRLSTSEREAEVARITTAEAQQAFELAAGPLLRAALLHVTPAESLFLLTMHHIVCDGWSMTIFFRELTALYVAELTGQPAQLAPLPIQYGDFAVWQRRRLAGGTLEELLGYWRRQLDGLPVLDLPTDRPRPPVQSFRGAVLPVELDPTLTAAARALARREGCTVFMVLLAAFQALLARYTQQTDIVVGTYIAGRERAETEPLIGFFVNTLVLRTEVGGNPTFRELLARVREVTLGAYAHQELPFAKLVEELQPARDPSRNPLFQVVFHLFNAPDTELSSDQAGALDARGTAIFDLVFSLGEGRDRLSGQVEYNTDLFEPDTVARLVGHFRVLLDAAAADPETTVADLPLLTEPERQSLVEWNATEAAYPRDVCLHELFEAQAARTPDAPALLSGDDTVTYAELNRRADAVACELAEHGVGAGARVAVCLPRSVELVVALLGVLKAGAAYVPLDPAHPRRRLSFVVRDARVAALVTMTSLAAGLEEAPVVVCLDRLDPRRTAVGARRAVGSDDCAYVMYTSGSTGEPKGVVATHRACVNRLAWMWERFPFAADEVCCLKTAVGFVDSVAELFAPLLRSVPLAILPDDIVRDPERFVEALAEARVTRVVVVPAALEAMLDVAADVARELERLRYCVSSGDVLPSDLARRFSATLPGCRLLNLYGSTEVAGDATCYEVEGASWRASVPIGRPIANTRAYVLDACMNPLPVGVPGELYVGGDGVARGYHDRRSLTGERFPRDPFSDVPGARLFRTGDIGRWLADGNLELLGRLDQQVKVRGIRVEPAEVETALREHDAVDDAVVVASEDGSEDRRLVAYVVPVGTSLPTSAELRSFLRERLPEPMVPSTFAFLDALPLGPSGKVDRLALPPLQAQPAPSLPASVAPRTPTEVIVADMTADLLGLDEVGAEDDFFALGGHSLLATRLVARLRDTFEVDLPLSRLFEAPTPAGLAAALLDDPASRLRVERTAELLQRVSELSDDEVDSMLSARQGTPRGPDAE